MPLQACRMSLHLKFLLNCISGSNNPQSLETVCAYTTGYKS